MTSGRSEARSLFRLPCPVRKTLPNDVVPSGGPVMGVDVSTPRSAFRLVRGTRPFLVIVLGLAGGEGPPRCRTVVHESDRARKVEENGSRGQIDQVIPGRLRGRGVAAAVGDRIGNGELLAHADSQGRGLGW